MKNEKLVTVIVPVFNHEKYISECLDSLINQQYQNWEAIVINDGSTDNSASILDFYQEKDSRFNVFHQNNVGIYKLYETYNKALELAKGEFIGVLEGDDYWPSDKLSKQVPSFFADDKIGVSWAGGNYVDINGKLLTKIIDQDKKWGLDVVNNNPVGKSLKYFLFASNFFNSPTSSPMYRTSALKEIGGFWQPQNGLKWNDKPTWILLSCKYKFTYVNFNGGFWRRHPTQITSINKDLKSSIYYLWSAISDERLEFKEYLLPYSINIELNEVLTELYRTKRKTDKSEYIKLFRQCIKLLLKYPVVTIKHIIFLLNVNRLNRTWK